MNTNTEYEYPMSDYLTSRQVSTGDSVANLPGQILNLNGE